MSQKEKMSWKKKKHDHPTTVVGTEKLPAPACMNMKQLASSSINDIRGQCHFKKCNAIKDTSNHLWKKIYRKCQMKRDKHSHYS